MNSVKRATYPHRVGSTTGNRSISSNINNSNGGSDIGANTTRTRQSTVTCNNNSISMGDLCGSSGTATAVARQQPQ
jgi:hypothetical protein